jgi:hypothetical protein
MKFSDILESVSHSKIVDTISLGTLLGILVGWLPHIASLVTIIWGVIRIYETRTVQDFLGKKTDAL